jgi:hypothetical protein
MREILEGFNGQERNTIKNALERFETTDQLMEWSSEQGLEAPPEQERSSDEDKEEINFGNLQQLTTFLWNNTGAERVKYGKEIAKALSKYADDGQLYYLDGRQYKKPKKIDKVQFDSDGRLIFYETDESTTVPDAMEDYTIGSGFNLGTGKRVEKMLQVLQDKEGKRLIKYTVKSGSLVSRILKKVFGADTPLNEQLEQKLKPIIKEVMKESYG